MDTQFSINSRQRQPKLIKTLKSIKVPCFDKLPTGPVPHEPSARQSFLTAPEADAQSFVYEVNDRALEPIYTPRDLLYLRILNQVYTPGAHTEVGALLPLHNHHLALVLNGRPQFCRFEVGQRARIASPSRSARLPAPTGTPSKKKTLFCAGGRVQICPPSVALRKNKSRTLNFTPLAGVDWLFIREFPIEGTRHLNGVVLSAREPHVTCNS